MIESTLRRRESKTMNVKRKTVIMVIVGFIISITVGCGTKNSNEFDETKEITVVSREDGSGTRGAFVELFEIKEKDGKGNEVDYTTEEANITNSTAVMMSSVSGNKYAIGYLSIGSLNDKVKAIGIDGIEATTENVKDASYKVSRPFNIATKGKVSSVAQDFIDYIMSEEGQSIVEESGYITIDGGKAYTGTKPEGKIVIAGSSSVTPVMEQLKEAYMKENKNVRIEIQQSDSTTGMTSVKEGICDIGMASRALKDSESYAGITATAIALDGIAIIVNNNSPVNELSSDQVKAIFTGEILTWDEVVK